MNAATSPIETNSRLIIKRLMNEGFVNMGIRGSHHKFKKDGKIVIVPHPKKSLPLGTARSIAKMAGWI
jgi:predicted RNA binding protein YcfA (HicA-like mRNA interferase family)